MISRISAERNDGIFACCTNKTMCGGVGVALTEWLAPPRRDCLVKGLSALAIYVFLRDKHDAARCDEEEQKQ
jgi:hypothetical protein